MRIVLFMIICLIFWALPQQLFAADKSSRPSSGGTVVKDDFDAAFDDDFADEFGENPSAEDAPLISDPLEGWNRGMFWVNDKLYFYALKPVAKGFRLVPRPARKSISNFFSNLATPVRAANALLQMRFRDTGTELGRFLVNSTIGWGGLFDPAGYSLGWKKKSEDFGQTLGHYGVKSGWYLFLPLLGPSSIRDGVGMVADQFLDPTRYVKMKEWEYYSLKILEPINRLSLDPDTYEGVKRDALDPYLFIRAAYAQHRLANIDK